MPSKRSLNQPSKIATFHHQPSSRNSLVHVPRLRSQLVHDGRQRRVCALDVPDGGLERVEQRLNLGALAADLLVENGVVGLGGLKPGVEEGLVGGERRGEVGGEDVFGGKEMGP